MSTLNREALIQAQRVTIDMVANELDQVEPTPLEDLNMIEVIGERRAEALNMMDVRSYNFMNEWVGSRDMSYDREVFKSLVHNRKWEDSERIPIEDIEDLNLANFDPNSVAENLRESYENTLAHEQHDYLIHAIDETYHGGEYTGPHGERVFVGSLDGEPLLSDSHPYFHVVDYDSSRPPGEQMTVEEGGTFSNLVDRPLSRDALFDAIEDFRTLHDHRGMPANMGRPNILLVGPALEREAREILESQFQVTETPEGVAAVDNEGRRLGLEVRVNNWIYGPEGFGEINFDGTTYTDVELDTSNFWYLVQNRADRNPFIWWNRKEPEVQEPVGNPSTFDDDSPAEGQVSYQMFMDDSAVIGIRARFGAAFGVPEVIYGSTGGEIDDLIID